MSAEAKLSELGIELPEAPAPVGNYVGGVKVGNLLFMSGCGPRNLDGSMITGKVGRNLTRDEGYAAARVVGLNMLAGIQALLGSLDKVKRVVKTLGMVNADPEFRPDGGGFRRRRARRAVCGRYGLAAVPDRGRSGNDPRSRRLIRSLPYRPGSCRRLFRRS